MRCLAAAVPIASKAAKATTRWSAVLATTSRTAARDLTRSFGIQAMVMTCSKGTKGTTRSPSRGANGTDTYTIFSDNGRVIFQRQPGNVGINMGGVESIFANSETIEMSGRNEVPQNTTTSSGFANFTYNAATGLFDIRMLVTGLATAIIDSHIHMNIPGSNGPVVVPFGARFHACGRRI